jgi:hypothetical protein
MTPWRGGFNCIPSLNPTWYQLTDPPFWTDRNWNIRAVIVRGATGNSENKPEPVHETWCRVEPPLFRNSTRINYAIPRSAFVTLTIYNARGTLIRRLVSGRASAGQHQAGWDGRTDDGGRAATGAYFYRLTVDGSPSAGKLVRLD